MLHKNSKSECLGGWLHKTQIIDLYEGAVVEVCERCKKRFIFRLDKGVPMNREYALVHERDILTPASPFFYREYPNSTVDKSKYIRN